MNVIDSWIVRGPFTAAGVGRFRIVFAVLALLTMPRLAWIGELPAGMFHPPLGPFHLLPSAPPTWTLVAIEVALALSLAALALGAFTTIASWATTALMLISYGLTYSFGKIDHSIILVVAPAVLSFARWGTTLSIDALRSRRPTEAQPQWPLRLLAVLVGVSFAYAGMAKATTGWLDPGHRAALGYMLREHHLDPGDPIQYVLGRTANWFGWEALDWAVVALELAVVIAALNWGAFRVVLAVLCLFHLLVLATLGIEFGWNVIVYGAFVSWEAIRAPERVANLLRAVGRLLAARPVLSVIAIAAVGWLIETFLPPDPGRRSVPIVVAGAVVAVGYLVVLIVRAFRRKLVTTPAN